MIQNQAESFFFNQLIIQNNNYGQLYNKQTHRIKKVILQDINKQIIQENIIFVEFNNDKINQQLFYKLNRFKYLNILQPLKYFEATNQQWVIYPDILEYRMTQDKLEVLKQQNKLDKFLLQLILTFNELERKNLTWTLLNLEQIYYNEEVLYLSLFDYDFTIIHASNNHNTLANFLYEYFYFYEELCKEIEFGLDILEEYILKKNDLHQINWLNPPYERVLQFILNIKNEQLTTLSENPNSVIKRFQTPQALKQVLPNTVEQFLMYKSISFNNQQQDQQIILQTIREIENFEQCSRLFYVAKCYFYFRIQQYCFLVQKLYQGNVRNLIDYWKVQQLNKIQIRKQVYFFAQRFAQCLQELHENNILHRDLKPENLLIDHFSFEIGDLYIVDLDRSKYLSSVSSSNVTSNMTDNTMRYNPPETPTQIQDFSYDIFQYGLIVLEVANKGKYVGNENHGPRYLEPQEFNSYYSLEAIRDRLLQIADFHEEFIKLIANCLKLNSAERPNAIKVYQTINKLHLNQKITKVQVNQQQQQL